MAYTLASSALVANTLTASATSSCPSCYFGVTAASLHSFSYTIAGTLTVETIPWIITNDDGCIVTSTGVSTLYPAGVTSYAGIQIFSNTDEMTWSVSNVAMSYPTTYVQYLGFEQDSFISELYAPTTRDFCAGRLTTSSIEIPTPTEPASFIYPLYCTPATTVSQETDNISVPVPTALVSYLEQVVMGPDGPIDIKNCNPLPQYFTNGPPPSTSPEFCYTTYSTIGYGPPTTTTVISPYGGQGAVSATSDPVITPSPETLSIINCYQVQASASSDDTTYTPGAIVETPAYVLSTRTGTPRPVSNSVETLTTRSKTIDSTSSTPAFSTTTLPSSQTWSSNSTTTSKIFTLSTSSDALSIRTTNEAIAISSTSTPTTSASGELSPLDLLSGGRG